uniref:Carboxypeptidase n=1 Tax=Panagrolaimus superbus TaxID=310955 RepID=A0A914YXK5_9BILA
MFPSSVFTTLVATFATLFNPFNEIKNLPGLKYELNFKQYSGFLQVSERHFLHYWFVESQNNSESDPLIFWFNGGPGCSSLDGILNEMGPFLVNKDGKTLRPNPHSWNTFASVVYVESPAGVGFSYSSDGNTTANDEMTALENYEAIRKFFVLYPSFRNHSVFIMGESYGGIYVPTLAARIIDGQKEFHINLNGIAIGNGYVNEKMNIETSIRFAYDHGYIDETNWKNLKKKCCHGCIEDCDLTQLTGRCGSMIENIIKTIWYGGINPYDIYRDCDGSFDNTKMESLRVGILPKKFLQLKIKLRDQENRVAVPCLDDTNIRNYLNSDGVRGALNIYENLPPWNICSESITESYQKQYTDMTPIVRKIINADVRVLLYYGDTDMACNFMMGQQFADRLGYPLLQPKTTWKFNKQIAGFKTIYDGVTFLTIRGAGHMAPQWRAPQTTYAIKKFVKNLSI